MEQFYYLSSLIFAIIGMLIIDYRFKLAFFNKPKVALLTMIISIAFFIIWDIAGINLGIFFNGDSNYDLGLFLFNEFPIEEIFFLFLLNYTALILYLGFNKKWQRI